MHRGYLNALPLLPDVPLQRASGTPRPGRYTTSKELRAELAIQKAASKSSRARPRRGVARKIRAANLATITQLLVEDAEPSSLRHWTGSHGGGATKMGSMSATPSGTPPVSIRIVTARRQAGESKNCSTKKALLCGGQVVGDGTEHAQTSPEFQIVERLLETFEISTRPWNFRPLLESTLAMAVFVATMTRAARSRDTGLLHFDTDGRGRQPSWTS